MVLEGLAAVGAAAAVVQFIGYGFKVISKGNELYLSTNGALEENEFLERVANDLKTLLDRIKQTSKPASLAVQSFRDDSVKLADEMLDALQDLKTKGLPSKWRSLRKALKAVHSKAKVESWAERLNVLRDQFNTHVEIDILENVNLLEVSVSSGFQQLSEAHQQRLQAFIDALRDAQDIFEQTIQQQLNGIRDSNRVEYDETRSYVESSHRKSRSVVKAEHEVTRRVVTEEDEATRRHVNTQHQQTRQYISWSNDELRSFIDLKEQQSLQHSETHHEQTVHTFTSAITAQNLVTEQNLRDDNSERVDFLQAELFRAQLENEANIREEHAWTRQTLQAADERHRVEAATNQQQTRAILEQALTQRSADQPAAAEETIEPRAIHENEYKHWEDSWKSAIDVSSEHDVRMENDLLETTRNGYMEKDSPSINFPLQRSRRSSDEQARNIDFPALMDPHQQQLDMVAPGSGPISDQSMFRALQVYQDYAERDHLSMPKHPLTPAHVHELARNAEKRASYLAFIRSYLQKQRKSNNRWLNSPMACLSAPTPLPKRPTDEDWLKTKVSAVVEKVPAEPEQCPYPDCQFSSPSHTMMKRHRRYRHTPMAERRYPCTKCSKRFLFPRSLRRHMILHGDKTRHKCPVSGCRYAERGFGRPDHVERHLRNAHPDTTLPKSG